MCPLGAPACVLRPHLESGELNVKKISFTRVRLNSGEFSYRQNKSLRIAAKVP